MPVEIKELVIRATVREAQSPAGNTPSPGNATKEQLVRECVEQVLDILKRKKER